MRTAEEVNERIERLSKSRGLNFYQQGQMMALEELKGGMTEEAIRDRMGRLTGSIAPYDRTHRGARAVFEWYLNGADQDG